MSDWISREAVLKAVYDWEEDWNSIYSAVLHLPAVSAKHDFAQSDAVRLRQLLEAIVDEYNDQTFGPIMHSIVAARAELEGDSNATPNA
jgi:hypothetical protein